MSPAISIHPSIHRWNRVPRRIVALEPSPPAWGFATPTNCGVGEKRADDDDCSLGAVRVGVPPVGPFSSRLAGWKSNIARRAAGSTLRREIAIRQGSPSSQLARWDGRGAAAAAAAGRRGGRRSRAGTRSGAASPFRGRCTCDVCAEEPRRSRPIAFSRKPRARPPPPPSAMCDGSRFFLDASSTTRNPYEFELRFPCPARPQLRVVLGSVRNGL
jgi:hypothetical protein